MAIRYKVCEVNTVTDDVMERVINEAVAEGWAFEGIQFAMRDASKRPAMAFVMFTREEEDEAPADNPPSEESEPRQEESEE